MTLDELRALRGADAPERWSLAALRGRLVALSARGAAATLTTAAFYPPDAAESGIDLAALVIVRAADATTLARAAERLLRSGAFGLIVLDLGAQAELSMQIQGRLVTLAQTHDAAVVCLTETPHDAASLGSLVSLRAAALRTTRAEHGELTVTLRALKDKRRGPGWAHALKRRGPAGM